mgnify:CR=1 FL=1
MKSFTLKLAAAAVAAACILPGTASASGGGSGPNVQYAVQGKIGEVITNPYKIAPLTAVIRNGGYQLKDAAVRIVPKHGGAEIKYNVSDVQLRTHAGIPVFGLYPDYNNTVEVSYTLVDGTKETRVENEVYRIYAPGIHTETNGTAAQHHAMFETEVKKVAPEFKDRLYFINNLGAADVRASRAVWNNPVGGALQWNNPPRNAILDTKGEIRWYMKADRIYDPESLYDAGIMMGFHQNADGALSWGYGQHYAKYDLLGRKVFNRRLPANYADFSHAMMPAENGGYFLRVASPDLRRADDTRVRTVRDVIIEVDASGEVVDEWRLFEILDPNRNIVLKSIDQGAVCLNIDTSQSGKTLSAEQLAKLEAQHAFGDIAGTGAGRNWAHVNSVDHDPVDDSIILSSRHQSAVVKIGRDKQVKWILAAPNGWRDGLKDKVLTPVGKDGRPLSCRIGKCEGGFDWTWTQHTAWKIDELSKGDIVYVSVFDNGDGRAFVQPEDQNEKYSRAVVYKIDQKAMTVEQVWEYGKERGHELYSPITSSVEYQADKNSVVVYWASIGTGSKTGPAPVLTEFRWGETKPAFEMHLKGGMGYRALPIDAQKAFVR